MALVSSVMAASQRATGTGDAIGATGTGDATNSGTIDAAQVRLAAADGNVYALAMNNGGVIRATGTKTENGRVVLTGTPSEIEDDLSDVYLGGEATQHLSTSDNPLADISDLEDPLADPNPTQR